MPRKKVIGGKDTLTRIEEHWEYIVENGEYPYVTEFARDVHISPNTFKHNYKGWAKKVAERRSSPEGELWRKSQGRTAVPKEKSPVTSKKASNKRDLEMVNKEMAKKISKLEKELLQKEKELEDLTYFKEEANNNQNLIEIIYYLLTELQSTDIKQSQFHVIQERVQKGIIPINRK